MPRATNNDGSLAILNYSQSGGGQCKIITPCGDICLRILPDISDSKGANYASEPIPGRTTPLLSYAYSEPRRITTELHFITTKRQDIIDNFTSLRIIQSLVYPGAANGIAPYTPPPVVKFICGSLMDGPTGLCLILKDYNVRYDPSVAWDAVTFLPYRFTISCSWEVVYACKNLPRNNCTAQATSPFTPPITDTANVVAGSSFYTKRAS